METHQRLLNYSKLVDMRNLLTPKKRENPTSMGDNNMIIALADKVAELVQRACKRLEIKASNEGLVSLRRELGEKSDRRGAGERKVRRFLRHRSECRKQPEWESTSLGCRRNEGSRHRYLVSRIER